VLRIYAIESEFSARTGILSVRADAVALVGPAHTVLAAEYVVEDDAADSADGDMERLSVAVAARPTPLQLAREDAWRYSDAGLIADTFASVIALISAHLHRTDRAADRHVRQRALSVCDRTNKKAFKRIVGGYDDDKRMVAIPALSLHS
jgi:hypothetical protein